MVNLIGGGCSGGGTGLGFRAIVFSAVLVKNGFGSKPIQSRKTKRTFLANLFSMPRTGYCSGHLVFIPL